MGYFYTNFITDRYHSAQEIQLATFQVISSTSTCNVVTPEYDISTARIQNSSQVGPNTYRLYYGPVNVISNNTTLTVRARIGQYYYTTTVKGNSVLTTVPSVVSSSPSDNQQKVLPGSTISVTFSSSIDYQETVDSSSFTLSDGKSNIPLSYTYNTSSNTIIA
jgi:hypothetical protein